MKRIVSLDIITGILIIHMIFGHIMRFAHCIDTDLYHYTSILLSFFMPWFFFKSGMFYKERKPVEVLLVGGVN